MGPDYRSPDTNKICNERDSVRGGGVGDRVVWTAYTGVIHCVFDQIPKKLLYHPQTKTLEGRGTQTDKHLPPRPLQDIFKKSHHLGLESISYFVHGLTAGSFPWSEKGVETCLSD
jgi:hypothetical protein